MKKVIVTLLLSTIFISSTFCMELSKRKDIPFAEHLGAKNRKKYLSIDLKIKKTILELATQHSTKHSPLNLKAKKARRKLAATDLKKYEKYAINLKELDPAKLWHGKTYLIRAQIKTDGNDLYRYGLFCMAYGISRFSPPHTDGTRILELSKEYRQAFAADSRVSSVKCTDGSGNSLKALADHLGFTIKS